MPGQHGTLAGPRQTLQITPLPLPHRNRTLLQELVGSRHIVGQPLAMGQGDPVEVEARLGARQCSLGSPPLPEDASDTQTAAPHQQGQERGYGRPPPGPLEEAFHSSDGACRDWLASEPTRQVLSEGHGGFVTPSRLLLEAL